MSRLPLARRYRPQRFTDVVGQEPIVRALSSATRNASISSSYVFSGTRGVGKTTIARIFAKALNCEHGPAADCCDACQACIEIRESRNLDVLEMDAATHTGIDDIRELRQAAQYPPSRDRYRVFILDEAHQLSAAAWNGLLKVLEEPPPWCLFVFCTTEPHKIPPTIESRSMHFAFRSPAPALLRRHLESIAGAEELEISGAALDLLVTAADGSVRDGMSALDQVRAVCEGAIDEAAVREALGLVSSQAVADYLDALLAGDAAAALALVDGLDDEGQDLRAFVADALDTARRRAVDTVRNGTPGESGGIEKLVWIGRVLDQTEARLRQGGPRRTLLDLATVRMARLADLTPLETLAARIEGGAPPRPSGPGRGSGSGGAGSTGSAGPGPRPAPRPAPRPTPENAPPGGGPREVVTPAPGGDRPELLARLVDALRAERPAAAPYLDKAESVEALPDGRLVVWMDPSHSLWAGKLSEGVTSAALSRAAAAVLGGGPAQVEIKLRAGAPGNGATGGVDAPASREEVLSRARKDPLVRSLFSRFGAVVLDGRAANENEV